MARFYGGVQGYRGEATRLGTPKSGLSVFGNGWKVGVRAYLHADPDGDKMADTVTIYVTTGSDGGAAGDINLGTFSRRDLNRRIARKAKRKVTPT